MIMLDFVLFSPLTVIYFFKDKLKGSDGYKHNI